MDLLQASFSRGEVSPESYGRVDEAFYQVALRTLRNFWVRAEGGAVNRPGLQKLLRTKYTTKKSREIPFVFSTTQTYQLEFGDQYIRVAAQGVPVKSGTAIAGIAALAAYAVAPATFIKATAVGHGRTTGDSITVSGNTGTGSWNINGAWAVTVIDADHYYIEKTPEWGVNANNGNVTLNVEVASPYLEAELPALRFTQSADVLTITHPNHPPYEFKRTSATAFTLTAMPFQSGPFLDVNKDTAALVYASKQTGSGITLTSTKDIFNANHVGALFKLNRQDYNGLKLWEPNVTLVTAGVSPVGLIRVSDGKVYQCATDQTYGAALQTGTIKPVHEAGVQPDGDLGHIDGALYHGVKWLYLDSGYAVFRITGYTNAKVVTAQLVVPSSDVLAGSYLAPYELVGGFTQDHAAVTKNGDGATTAFSLGYQTIGAAGTSDLDSTNYEVLVDTATTAAFTSATTRLLDPSEYTLKEIAGPNTQITFLTPPPTGTNNISVRHCGLDSGTHATQFKSYRSNIWAFGAWSPDQGYPATVTYHQDRLTFGGTPGQPQLVGASKVGAYHDYGFSTPGKDDDGLTFRINAREQNAVAELIPLADLILGTSSAIWRLTGGQTGKPLTPSTLDAKPQTFWGVGSVASVLYGDSAIYLQEGDRHIRDLIYTFQLDKYSGSELTLLARHLFPVGRKCVAMTHAAMPFGQLFALRDDGELECCTYLRDEQVIGWSHCDTTGIIEDVLVMREGQSYNIYCTVLRYDENGAPAARYLERFAPREFADRLDGFFVDAGITYDGRNTSAVTMTLSGGSTWNAADTGTLTGSAATWGGFSAADVLVNEIWLTGVNAATGASETCRVKLTAYTSATSMTVEFIDPVPVSLRAVAVTAWTYAKLVITGLAHLEGQYVAVQVDGSVLANDRIVYGASITLSSPAGVVHAGLPYLCDFEPLDMNLLNQPPIRGKAKFIPQVQVLVKDSSPFKAGPDVNHLNPVAMRDYEPMTAPTDLASGIVQVYVPCTASQEGRFFIRQDRPAPLTILGTIPDVQIGESG